MLPDASTAFQVIVVNPNGNCFGALLVMVTDCRSTTVGLSNCTVLLFCDVASTVILVGGVIFGAVVSTTSIICVALDILPDVSFAVHRTLVFPSGNVFDALLVIVTG